VVSFVRPQTTVGERRLVWPVLAGVAVGGVVVGTRVSLSQPIPTLLGVLLTTLGVAVLVALPGLATLALLSRWAVSTASRFGVLLSGSGVAAYVDFWAWVASPTLGRVVAAGFLVTSITAIVTVRPTVLLDDSELRKPLGMLLVVVFGYVGLAYSQGGLGGAHWLSGARAGDTTVAMAYRYWLAPDNTVPLLFAQRVASQGPLNALLLGDWHTSDRPPLQTGFVLMLYPLFGLKSFAYQFLGTVLQALWIPALWILLRSRGVGPTRVLIVVVCTAATGVIFVNTVYVWPKMLAGALVLAALAVVLEEGSLVLAAVLVALALLAHGGIAFSMLAFLPLVWKCRPSKLAVGRALAAGALLYLPWIAYQRFLDPPGDRLLKWHLAGLIAPDRNSFLHDLVRQYLHRPVHSLVVNKLLNLERLVFVHPLTVINPGSAGLGFLGTVRFEQLDSLLLGTGPLLLGLLGLASATVRRSLRPLWPVMLFVLLSVLCWVILEYGGRVETSTIIHQGSYAVLILAVALSALAVTYLRTWAAVTIIVADVTWFGVEYLPGLSFHWEQPGLATSTSWAMIALGLGSLAILGLTMLRGTMTLRRGATVERPSTESA
jgi:hypothetical protein